MFGLAIENPSSDDKLIFLAGDDGFVNGERMILPASPQGKKPVNKDVLTSTRTPEEVVVRNSGFEEFFINKLNFCRGVDTVCNDSEKSDSPVKSPNRNSGIYPFHISMGSLDMIPGTNGPECDKDPVRPEEKFIGVFAEVAERKEAEQAATSSSNNTPYHECHGPSLCKATLKKLNVSVTNRVNESGNNSHTGDPSMVSIHSIKGPTSEKHGKVVSCSKKIEERHLDDGNVARSVRNVLRELQTLGFEACVFVKKVILYKHQNSENDEVANDNPTLDASRNRHVDGTFPAPFERGTVLKGAKGRVGKLLADEPNRLLVGQSF